MGEWRPYTFQEYLLRTKKGELTPSHLKFYEKILGKIYVHSMEMKIKNDEIIWEDREVAYVGEPADDYEEPPKYIVQGQEPATGPIGQEYQPPPVMTPRYYDRYVQYRGRIEHLTPPGAYMMVHAPSYPPPYHNPMTAEEVMRPYLWGNLTHQPWWNEAEENARLTAWNENIHAYPPYYQN